MILNPVKMSVPRPPAPIKAASVALAITSVAAVLMPAKIRGKARGSFTCQKTCQGVRPNEAAASAGPVGNCENATVVLIRITGSASTISASIAAGTPIIPVRTTIRKSSAKLGITRNVEKVPVTKVRTCLLHADKTPNGKPAINAAKTDAVAMYTCCHSASKKSA